MTDELRCREKGDQSEVDVGQTEVWREELGGCSLVIMVQGVRRGRRYGIHFRPDKLFGGFQLK